MDGYGQSASKSRVARTSGQVFLDSGTFTFSVSSVSSVSQGDWKETLLEEYQIVDPGSHSFFWHSTDKIVKVPALNFAVPSNSELFSSILKPWSVGSFPVSFSLPEIENGSAVYCMSLRTFRSSPTIHPFTNIDNLTGKLICVEPITILIFCSSVSSWSSLRWETEETDNIMKETERISFSDT